MSSFKNILKSHKEGQEPPVDESPLPSPAPSIEAKAEEAPKAGRSTSKGDQPKKKRGRPNGKRSDNDFTQVTAYIREDTHLAVKTLLLKKGETRDFSDLVEELLGKWVKSRT